MKLLVISASMRGESQSLKVSHWLREELQNQAIDVQLLDLHEFALPLFDDGETLTPKRDEVRALLDAHDGYVFVSPEWNGMMSHGLVNMLHYAGHTMAYKPVMLVGVSSGRGGTHPVDQMRIVGPKNRHYVISPENLIISGVKEVFNDHDMNESSPDYPLKRRAVYGLTMLQELTIALQQVRNSGKIDFENFGNGV